MYISTISRMLLKEKNNKLLDSKTFKNLLGSFKILSCLVGQDRNPFKYDTLYEEFIKLIMQ